MVQEPRVENDPSINYGKFLSHPPVGDEVSISGLSGQFPLSSNIEEFKYNLYNKVNMISHSPHVIHPEIPPGIGKLSDGDLSKFDTGFFGIHKQQALTMNAMCRLLLEKCVECIFDAGLQPSDLEGTKTGVFTGICFAESECHWYLKELVKDGNAVSGNMKAMIANRISYFFKLNAPSFNADTACSSSLYALDAAYQAIRKGEIDQALVCGSNTLLAPGSTLQFARLGVLSKEGILRAFDEAGSGYVRSEAISVMLLQKAKYCHRIYAQILHMKTSCDGYKEEGITYPSGKDQLSLLKEIYSESGIDPKDISFMEAHGTGTPVGDPEELNRVDSFFAKGRTAPLLVGSVKSSIGHSEPASGLCSIVKAILAFETGSISPNINFETPRKTIPGLLEGRMKVVVENTPFQDQNGLIGVNSFGFGGANVHVILKWNSKKKIGNGKPLDNLPRLVCVSGRTKDAVQYLLADVAKKFDVEHIGLIHNLFRKPIQNHLFRGYTIVSKEGVSKQSIKPFNPNKRQLHIYFGGITNSDSGNLAEELLSLKIFYNFKNRIQRFLKQKELSLDMITSSTSYLNHLLHALITQLTLAELLTLLDVECDGVSADSFGEFSCAYFEKSLSLEEVLECVYVVGKVVDNMGVTKHGGNINEEVLSNYRNQILTNLEQILTCPKEYNGYNGTEIKTTSPQHFVNAIFGNAENGASYILKNSIILEIGQGLGALRKGHFNNTLSFDYTGGFQGTLAVIGSLYEVGMHPQVQKLYSQIQFPVSKGTPMISSKIQWKHDYKYFIPTFEANYAQKGNSEAIRFQINLKDEQWADLEGHVIDGRNLFPATGYLYLAWYVMGEVHGIDLNQLKVVFENCKFKRACTLPNISSSSDLDLCVMVQKTSGKFEVSEGDVTIVTGRVRIANDLPELDSDNDADQPNDLSNNELLNNKDIYKELRLRGYNYKGLFKSLISCNKAATIANIQWAGSWIAFADNMLQLKILAEDTRLLYVPISIAKLTINPNAHLKSVERLKRGGDVRMVEIPVQNNPYTGIIRSGGIEIQGLLASSIPRKKSTAVPVLEKYQFVPNLAKLTLEQSARVFIQVALENNCGLKVSVAELIDEASDRNIGPLGPIIQEVLADQPLVHSDVTILTKETLDDLGVKVENNTLKSNSEYTVVVGSGLLSRNAVLEEAIKATIESGYIISREPLILSPNMAPPSNFIVLNISETNDEKLVFLKKCSQIDNVKSQVYINVSCKNRTFDWLSKLKDGVSKGDDVIAWCQNEPLSGIIGLVNCIRREPACQNVRSIFVTGDAPDFDPSNPFYKKQLDKNMGVNVYLNGQWGTYRHLLLDNLEEVENGHCYVNSTVRGDLSSIKWIEGPLSKGLTLKHNESVVDVYYSSLNFRDVMTASGRINVDVITRDRRKQECVQGFEFSGKTKSGKRVMGMVSQGALATLIQADNNLLWEVPDLWSLKDAATVPVVYCTCLYALEVIGKIKPTDSILIHSGTGGIGQAAINLCLNMGCTVFTTVGTDEKRQFILRNFPKIYEKYVGNSRDLSFEQMIMKQTHGKGVDVVLNSLADEKLFASARCLSANGRFLEIGKFDLANDSQLNLLSFRSGASYHGVMLDKLFNESSYVKNGLNNLLQKYICTGAVKPLMSNVFEKTEVEQAFRFMAAGKHMGKVLVKIRNEDEYNIDQNLHLKVIPRYFCDPDKSYIICGGLGGFGLELADWLVLRGAKNLVLSSRKGISTGYQSYRISTWISYGCCIKISTQNITLKSGCIELIKEANSLAPIDAIFNLAVVLDDAILENQTAKTFNISFGPKAYATEYLDEITRDMCPELRSFVVFSSVSCGRGNAGQSNYGMSNSIMERICEKRKNEGYPALAIQWGIIGDVGLVAELQKGHIELEISGTLQQNISNCLQVMDVLLRQPEAAVVSSIVVAEKRTASFSGRIEEVIGAILGIRDIKSVSMHSTLAELGMDSMTGNEVNQTLHTEYNIFLTPSEMRSVTLARIREIQEKSSIGEPSVTQCQDDNFDLLENILKSTVFEGMNSVISKLRNKYEDETVTNRPKIIALPGVEGNCFILQNLTQNLEADVYGLNYLPSNQTDDIHHMVETLLPHVIELLKPTKTFNVIAHSFGSIVALEIVSKLEKLGYVGNVTLLDGSPSSMRKLANNQLKGRDRSDIGIENALLAASLRFKLNTIESMNVIEEIGKCLTFKEKLKICTTKLNLDDSFSKELLINSTVAAIKRHKACLTYTPAFEKLKSKVRLFKPTILTVNMDSQDYDLSQLCEHQVEINVCEGTHNSFLENKEMAKVIMEDIAVIKGLKDE